MRARTWLLASALAVGIAGSATPAAAQIGDMDLPVYFTFSQPVSLPRATLPAGKYLFKLVNSGSSRSVVQVSDAAGKQVGFFITVPVQRNQPPNDPEVRFLESPANMPTAVATYWYPGRKMGWEFVYPRSQATALAESSKQAVLTTASSADASDDEMRIAPLARVSPTGDQAAVGDTPADITVAGNSARGEMAEAEAQTTPAPSTTLAQNTTPEPAAAPARTRLPQTSSPMPLVVLIGGLLLCAGLILRMSRRLGV